MSNTDFYKAFEDRYRGTQSSIQERLETYQPLLNALAECGHSGALDLGCGRGEWLERLNQKGFSAKGIDLDHDMIKACADKGLSVRVQDAQEALRESRANSLGLISGFHIVEHLRFDTLVAIVKDAYRVLSPGGVLLFETPNPENISVGTSAFYMDPTHRKPLPPNLLAFLCEFCGFSLVRIIRLNENKEIHQKAEPTLMDVIWESSPDYAVVAQKTGDQILSDKCQGWVNQASGMSLESLVSRHDWSLINRIQHSTNLSNQAVMQAIEALNVANIALARATEANRPGSWVARIKRIFKSDKS